MEDKNHLTKHIIGCCFKIHKCLGPGFNERVCAIIYIRRSGLWRQKLISKKNYKH